MTEQLPVAIRANHSFDGERFRPGPTTVLLDGGRIVAVEDGYPEVGEHWQLIEAPAGTVLPGLIDTHAHLVCDSAMGALDRVAGYTEEELDAVITEGLRRQLANGVTTVRDLGDRRFSVVDRRDRQRSGSAVGPEPTILAAGPPLTSPRGHCFYLGGEVQGTKEIEAALDERADRRVDVVKVMASGGMNTAGTDVMRTQFTLQDMTLMVDRAHTAGLPVTAHAHGLPAVEQALAVGTEGIEHCSCLTDKGVELSVELADRLATSGVVVGGFIPVPPIVDLSQAPPGIREMMQKSGLTPERVNQMRLEWLGRLLGSGVRLTTGPDSGINSFVQHGYLHRAVEFLVQAGASHEKALAGATSVAAEGCSVGDRKGFLRLGYDADVLVVDGDLSAEIRALAAVRAVVVGGTVLG